MSKSAHTHVSEARISITKPRKPFRISSVQENGSLVTLKNYGKNTVLQCQRQEKNPRKETLPGEEAQVDFGQYKMKDMYGRINLAEIDRFSLQSAISEGRGLNLYTFSPQGERGVSRAKSGNQEGIAVALRDKSNPLTITCQGIFIVYSFCGDETTLLYAL